MSTFNSSFDYEAESERQHRMAEEDRSGFFKVVIAASIAMFVMLFALLSVLLMAGQRVMPLHSHHLVANALLVWPVAEAGQGTVCTLQVSDQALACLSSTA